MDVLAIITMFIAIAAVISGGIALVWFLVQAFRTAPRDEHEDGDQ